jgi:hypothetical protein
VSIDTCKLLGVAKDDFEDGQVTHSGEAENLMYAVDCQLIHQHFNSLRSGEASAIAIRKSEPNDNNNTNFQFNLVSTI